MQLKLAPHNTPWQWKIIQGEVAKRHIATLFFALYFQKRIYSHGQ